jgi:hypothetical protein
MDEYESLSHSKWECKYHVVFIPKCRRNFALGVATGLTMELEFGTNWSFFSGFVGDVFGAPLAIEGLMAFFMESTFVGLMVFGWERRRPGQVRAHEHCRLCHRVGVRVRIQQSRWRRSTLRPGPIRRGRRTSEQCRSPTC